MRTRRTTTDSWRTGIEALFACVEMHMQYFGGGLPTSITVEVRRLSNCDLLVDVAAQLGHGDAVSRAGAGNTILLIFGFDRSVWPLPPAFGIADEN